MLADCKGKLVWIKYVKRQHNSLCHMCIVVAELEANVSLNFISNERDNSNFSCLLSLHKKLAKKSNGLPPWRNICDEWYLLQVSA